VRATGRPLTPGWVAGSIRARAMLSRRVGRDGARELAACASLGEARARLSATAYGRALRSDATLADAQRAVADTFLWHVRVLAGWVLPSALEPIRALAAWFELANIDERVAYLCGGPVARPFALGGLATAWPQLADAQSLTELRERLAASPWGDPGAPDRAAIRVGLRLAWARRVLSTVEEAAEWAAGAVALLVARELLLAARPASVLAAARPPGIGTAWETASDLDALRAALAPGAAWTLEGIDEPRELWRGEAGWWRRVEGDAERLAHAVLMGRSTVIGSVVLLAADGRRTAGALEIAARGGRGDAMEVFDELA